MVNQLHCSARAAGSVLSGFLVETLDQPQLPFEDGEYLLRLEHKMRSAATVAVTIKHSEGLLVSHLFCFEDLLLSGLIFILLHI